MKLFRYTLPLLAALCLLTGCGPSGKRFTIEGEFTAGMKGGELYLLRPDQTDGHIDTLTIQNGKFHYEGEVEDTLPFTLLFHNALEQVIFVSPAKSIKYVAAANDLKNYQVLGSEENELMNQFRQETSTLKDLQIPNIAKQYIQAHTASPVALYLYQRYFVQTNHKEASALLKLLQKHHPDNHQLFSTEALLKHTDAFAKGKKIPDVTLTLKSRQKQHLWANSTKDHTLIFFWATYLQDGYNLLYAIRDIQERNKENLRTVGISLDNEKYRWEDLIRRDSLLIDHFCDGLAWASPTIQQLGLSTLPFYVITDRSHKVIATGTNIDQLKKDINNIIK